MGLLALCWRGDISVVSTLLTSLKQLGVGLAIRVFLCGLAEMPLNRTSVAGPVKVYGRIW